MTKTCAAPDCKATFVVTKGNRRYCRPECRQNNNGVKAERSRKFASKGDTPCVDCGVIVPAGSHNDRGKCRDCMNAYHRAWRAANKESAAASVLKYRMSEKGRNSRLVYHRKSHYGLDPEVFGAMLLAQGNQCAICECVFDDEARPACVDHDHATGRVRGLLCRQCNAGIGSLGDNADTVARAVAYLREAA